MTKTETRKLLLAHHQARKITRQIKTAQYRRDSALLLVGYIQALQDQAKLFEKGESPVSKDLAEMCRLRESVVTKQLRKL